MTAREIVDAIESAVPVNLQENYDNSGLIVGRIGDEVRSALLCVDVTEEVITEALALGANMIISHHPLIFHPLKRLNGVGYVERLVEKAIRENIILYACHTNLDSVWGGMSFRLGEDIGLQEMRLLEPRGDADGSGFGVVGELREPMPVHDFLKMVADRLSISCVRHSDMHVPAVSRVALCTGAGGGLIPVAVAAGADLYLCADLRYNDFLDWRVQITVADIGHFESEYCAIDLMYDIITKKIPTFALHRSTCSRNPVNYLVNTH